MFLIRSYNDFYHGNIDADDIKRKKKYTFIDRHIKDYSLISFFARVAETAFLTIGLFDKMRSIIELDDLFNDSSKSVELRRISSVVLTDKFHDLMKFGLPSICSLSMQFSL